MAEMHHACLEAYRLLLLLFGEFCGEFRSRAGNDATMNKFDYGGAYLFLVCILGLTNCALPPQRVASQQISFVEEGKKTHKGQVTQAELQDDLLRFESQFNARIQSANQALENSDNLKIRYRAAMNRLIYGSNSLNIALGPSPESNLLDMITFIKLSHDVLNRHWIPEVFGPAGQALNQAFSESKQQIWAIAEKVLSVEQKNLLKKVILDWRTKHSKQINIEAVRLSAFSTEAGAKAAGLDEDVGGLFASVQQSTQSIDSVRLFGERALYYAERAPFLFRLQARLGAHEIIDDAGLGLAQMFSPQNHERIAKNILKEFQQTLLVTRETLGDANATVESIKTLMDQLAENPEAAKSATDAIQQLTALLKDWNHLLSSAPYQKGVSQITDIASQVSRESNRLLMRLTWLGVSLIAFFWVMSVLSKLFYRYLKLKLFDQTKAVNQRNKAA